jgi:transcriptional regulator with XRE-family HTH domain
MIRDAGIEHIVVHKFECGVAPQDDRAEKQTSRCFNSWQEAARAVIDGFRWSMRELSRRSGISHSHAARIVNGEVNPSADVCRRLARALNVAETEILKQAGYITDKPGETDNFTLREIWSYLKTMDHDQLRVVREIVRFQSGNRRASAGVAEGANNYNLTSPTPGLSTDPETT